MCGVLFLFQAEDGIRDLVRSRGLGDVYKRQVTRPVLLTATAVPIAVVTLEAEPTASVPTASATPLPPSGPMPVSYTHLTLPTSDLV